MNICVYGASSDAIDRDYIKTAEEVGTIIAQRGHTIIYGGGARGIMGGVAAGAYEHGGKIIGVVPSFFNVDGKLFEHCTELIFTETLQERERVMEENADAFLVMPGGVGTFNELFEVLALKQLGRHAKAIAVFNQKGYYNDISELFDKAISEKFMVEKSGSMFSFFTDVNEMIEYIERYKCLVDDIKHFRNI